LNGVYIDGWKIDAFNFFSSKLKIKCNLPSETCSELVAKLYICLGPNSFIYLL